MAADDAEHHGEPQAGAGSGALGGEERIEDAIEHRRGHPRARVADFPADVVAWFAAATAGFNGGREDHIFRLEPQLAAAGHGIAGVQAQVEEDLLQLRLVAQQSPRLRGNGRQARDVAGKGAGDDADDFRKHRVRRDG